MGLLLEALWFVGALLASDARPLWDDAVLKSLFNVLTWEHNLKARCPGGLKIAVLARPDPEDQKSARVLVEAIKRGGYQAQGLTASAEVIAIAPGQAARQFEEHEICCALLSAGLEAELSEIGAVAKVRHILLATQDLNHLGVASVAFLPLGGLVRFRIDPRAAESQGARLDSRLLRIAEAQDADRPIVERPEETAVRRIAGHDPEYPAFAREVGVVGKVVVEVRIGADGRVVAHSFLESDRAFEDTVAAAIRSWRFAPRLEAGRAVSTVTVFKYTFQPAKPGAE
ncbi:MAG TPA: TonB family protein [Myxococcota bacterium]|nr:TonB family protein [Myxococcota bacterium]HRY97274.1 TonB family protein [Myxococcota bacterium]